MKTLKHLIIFAIVISGFVFTEGSQAEDCSCPVVSCGPCQKKVTVGKIVKFCDWGDINVCRKVICENVSFFFKCISQQNKKMTPLDDTPKDDLELAYDKGKKKSKNRKPASQNLMKHSEEKIKLATEGRIEVANDSRVDPGITYSDVVIGEISKVDKTIKVLHRGKMAVAKKGQKLFVGDEFFNNTKNAKKISISFEGGSVSLQLKPKSKLTVHDPHSILGRFQPFLYLVHGGVEYTVDMQKGSFDLLAGQILARAPRGKVSVNYEMGPEGLKVKVEAIKGLVEVIKAQDLSGRSIDVQEGNFVSWVSETAKDLFTMDEKMALADEGFITPVFEMSETRKKQVGLHKPKAKPLFADWSKKQSQMDGKGRDVASLDGALCQSPSAQFQQCAWTCEGNKKGLKNCQAKKDDVHCVRRICNAAGQWGTPTAFASSYGDLCPAEGTRVGDCSP